MAQPSILAWLLQCGLKVDDGSQNVDLPGVAEARVGNGEGAWAYLWDDVKQVGQRQVGCGLLEVRQHLQHGPPWSYDVVHKILLTGSGAEFPEALLLEITYCKVPEDLKEGPGHQGRG